MTYQEAAYLCIALMLCMVGCTMYLAEEISKGRKS